MHSPSPVPFYDSDDEGHSCCASESCAARRSVIKQNIKIAQDDCECDYRNCYVLELEIAALEETIVMWELQLRHLMDEREALQASINSCLASQANFLQERTETLGAIWSTTKVCLMNILRGQIHIANQYPASIGRGGYGGSH
jgi:hypothetical protein